MNSQLLRPLQEVKTFHFELEIFEDLGFLQQMLLEWLRAHYAMSWHIKSKVIVM